MLSKTEIVTSCLSGSHQNSDEVIRTPKERSTTRPDFRTHLPQSFANLATTIGKCATPKVVAASGSSSQLDDTDRKPQRSVTMPKLSTEPHTDILVRVRFG